MAPHRSKEFGKRLSSYDPKSDDDHFLNRAVMYVVWHQFFSFGTRAICDAYQDHKSFSKNSGIGILSDKDFANGYKTRLILAASTTTRAYGSARGQTRADSGSIFQGEEARTALASCSGQAGR